MWLFVGKSSVILFSGLHSIMNLSSRILKTIPFASFFLSFSLKRNFLRPENNMRSCFKVICDETANIWLYQWHWLSTWMETNRCCNSWVMEKSYGLVPEEQCIIKTVTFLLRHNPSWPNARLGSHGLLSQGLSNFFRPQNLLV